MSLAVSGQIGNGVALQQRRLCCQNPHWRGRRAHQSMCATFPTYAAGRKLQLTNYREEGAALSGGPQCTCPYCVLNRAAGPAKHAISDSLADQTLPHPATATASYRVTNPIADAISKRATWRRCYRQVAARQIPGTPPRVTSNPLAAVRTHSPVDRQRATCLVGDQKTLCSASNVDRSRVRAVLHVVGYGERRDWNWLGGARGHGCWCIEDGGWLSTWCGVYYTWGFEAMKLMTWQEDPEMRQLKSTLVSASHRCCRRRSWRAGQRIRKTTSRFQGNVRQYSKTVLTDRTHGIPHCAGYRSKQVKINRRPRPTVGKTETSLLPLLLRNSQAGYLASTLASGRPTKHAWHIRVTACLCLPTRALCTEDECGIFFWSSFTPTTVAVDPALQAAHVQRQDRCKNTRCMGRTAKALYSRGR